MTVPDQHGKAEEFAAEAVKYLGQGGAETAAVCAALAQVYATLAVAVVFGHQAGRFAAAIAAVQAILGDHQDTVVAEAWLRATGAALSPACVSAGELIAAERTERPRLRSGWPNVWKRATARKLRRWL